MGLIEITVIDASSWSNSSCPSWKGRENLQHTGVLCLTPFDFVLQ